MKLSGFVFLPWLIALGVAALGGSLVYSQQDVIKPALQQFAPAVFPPPSPTPTPTPSPLTLPHLSAALSAPYPLECQTSADSPLKGDRVYVDPATRSFRINSTNSSLKQHLIFRDTTFWSWFDGATDGDTLNISAVQPNPLEIANNLVCEPWTTDPTYFTLPDNINFTVTQARIDKAWEAKRQLDARIKEINDSLNQ